MRAKLVTLSGSCGQYHDNQEEMMGGFFGDVWDVISAPAKGIGHMVMEGYRGISRGDIGRFLLAPVKGAGHTLGVSSRAVLRSSCDVAKLSTPGALAPGPQQPFVVATSAVSNVACGISSSRSRTAPQTIVVGGEKKKSNAIPIAIGVAGAATGLYLLLKG